MKPKQESYLEGPVLEDRLVPNEEGEGHELDERSQGVSPHHDVKESLVHGGLVLDDRQVLKEGCPWRESASRCP